MKGRGYKSIDDLIPDADPNPDINQVSSVELNFVVTMHVFVFELQIQLAAVFFTFIFNPT